MRPIIVRFRRSAFHRLAPEGLFLKELPSYPVSQDDLALDLRSKQPAHPTQSLYKATVSRLLKYPERIAPAIRQAIE